MTVATSRGPQPKSEATPGKRRKLLDAKFKVTVA
jgi:hypothetical protein